ncbi:hypothetical protein AB5L52_08695 [Streptomyces sp. CG4]|uniref:hypothetical protein n=1 Tax=Streptomyces sp. CG4 TaxID=408783 RepID=UPI0034E1FB52
MTRADGTRKVWDRLLGWLLPDGGPADSLAQEDVERFCWYGLPAKWVAEPAEYPHIFTALAELLQDAGRPRSAAVCTSETTREILAAWQHSPDQGRAAYRRAVDASPVTPPDTDLLTWGPVMGIDEAVARSNASRLLEQALDDGALVPGTRGYAAARIEHVERWLTTPHPRARWTHRARCRPQRAPPHLGRGPTRRPASSARHRDGPAERGARDGRRHAEPPALATGGGRRRGDPDPSRLPAADSGHRGRRALRLVSAGHGAAHRVRRRSPRRTA